MRARVTVTVLAFFVALAATGTPASPGAGGASAGRAQALGGEIERTPVVAAHPSAIQSNIARAASARPAGRLPPVVLALDLDAAPAWSASARANEAPCAPMAPPAAPRSCRGPPRA